MSYGRSTVLTCIIDEGETVGLVGESGCGKSVAALSIVRLVPDPPGRIVKGEVLFEGVDLLQLGVHDMRHVRGGKDRDHFPGAVDVAEPGTFVRASDHRAVAGASGHDATAGIGAGVGVARHGRHTRPVGPFTRLPAHDERWAASTHHDRHRIGAAIQGCSSPTRLRRRWT